MRPTAVVDAARLPDFTDDFVAEDEVPLLPFTLVDLPDAEDEPPRPNFAVVEAARLPDLPDFADDFVEDFLRAATAGK